MHSHHLTLNGPCLREKLTVTGFNPRGRLNQPVATTEEDRRTAALKAAYAHVA